MAKQVENRPARNDEGQRLDSAPRHPAWWKRVDIWALGVSVVALTPSIWTFAGDYINERQSVASYFKSITDDSVGGSKPTSERIGVGLAYAAPDSDAWIYAAQLQKQWAAFEYGGVRNIVRVDSTYDEFRSQLCDESDGHRGCLEVGNVKFDDQNRLESFTIDNVSLHALIIPAADGPYQGNQDPTVRVTLKGGQRFPSTGRVSLVFEIWNASGSDVTVEGSAILKDFDRDASVNLVGPSKLVQGQRALYYTAGTGKNPQWLQFAATSTTKGKFTYFLPLD